MHTGRLTMAQTEQIDERKLLERIRQGERSACEELVRDYYRAIYGFQAHLCRDTHLAEDLTQETFVAAWSSLDNFAGHSSLKTWLSQIAYHKFIDAKRRCRLQTDKAMEFQASYAAQADDRPAGERMLVAERCSQLYDAVSELDEGDRLVIMLHYFQSLSYREMAAVLGRPSGTVKWQTSQALGRLKNSLNGKMEL
jgi:RNA polymerase sigma-70 factor, ECF subfamily